MTNNNNQVTGYIVLMMKQNPLQRKLEYYHKNETNSSKCRIIKLNSKANPPPPPPPPQI